MQPKDSKKLKLNIPNSNQGTNNKKLESKVLINKIISKTKSSKIPSDSNNHNQKGLESKLFSGNYIKNNRNANNEKKNKNAMSNYQAKTNYERRGSKFEPKTRQKITNKLNEGEKKLKKNKGITKKNSCTFEGKKNNPFTKANNDITDKKKKIEFYKNYASIINSKQLNNINNESITGIGTKKLLEFLVTLSPIGTSKCHELITKNINKIIELENKIKDIIKKTQDDIKNIKEKGNKDDKENESNNDNTINFNKIYNENNKNNLEENIQIIGKESNMRKSIYRLLFSFIMQLLEQINRLSYNIANQELRELNNNNDNLFMINNNPSITSNNSLFMSEIQDDFCERLINITKSFISSDIDLSEINGKNKNIEDIKNNFSTFGQILDDNLFNDEDDQIIEYNGNDPENILKNKNKKNFMIHPNEILDKIQIDEKKGKKIIHHYSNSLKVNSNLEKLERKKNKEEDDINDKQMDNIGKGKNCNIF